MTTADKLRELLANRSANPDAQEQARWWFVGAQLVQQLLAEPRPFDMVEIARLDRTVADLREAHAADARAYSEERERLLATLRREQDARAELRVELDRAKAELSQARRDLCRAAEALEYARG